MGELRKKLGMGFLKSMNFVLVIVLSFGLASSIQYGIYTKVIKTDTDMYIQYLVYFLYALSLIFAIGYYIKRQLSVPISLYEKGIVLKRNKKTIMHDEIKTFYFIPNSDKKIKFLVIQGSDDDKVVFATSYVGEDFLDHFQKDYIIVNTDKFMEKINQGEQLRFGMLSSKQLFMLKIFKSKNAIKGLKFEDEFIISKDSFTYKESSYKWKDIKTQYDMQTSNIVISDDENNEIISTYFSCVEKGSFAFNLIDYIIEHYNKMFEEVDEMIEEFDNLGVEEIEPEFNKAQDDDYNKGVESNYENIVTPYTIGEENHLSENENLNSQVEVLEAEIVENQDLDNINVSEDTSFQEVEIINDTDVFNNNLKNELGQTDINVNDKIDNTISDDKSEDDIDISDTDITTAIKLEKDN